MIECPVCGANELSTPPYKSWPPPARATLKPPYEDTLGTPSYEVCPSCGFEFGNDDNPGTAPPVSFAQYRAQWIADGAPLFDEKLLVIVAEVFELTERPGVTLTPNVERDYEPGDYDVVLDYPGRGQAESTANLSWVHFYPGGFRLVCRLPTLSKREVPPGTRIRLA